MTASERKQHVFIGVNVLGVGYLPASWQTNELQPRALFDIEYWERVARVAERGKLDALFLADHPGLGDPRYSATGRFEPTTIWSRIASITERIGLIATLSTTYNDPYELAERFQTLNAISLGRAAWNAVTTFGPDSSANFGLASALDRDARYRRAEEFLQVVRGLWHSAHTGEEYRHDGEFFSIAGRLRRQPASPAQPDPLIVQAGGSPQGRLLAGRHANGVFSAELDLEAGLEHYRLVKDAAVQHGRRSRDVNILPGLHLTLGSTEEEARRRLDGLYDIGGSDATLERLNQRFAYDLTRLDPEQPFPEFLLAEVEDTKQFAGSLGFRESVVRDVRKHGSTVGEYIRRARYEGTGHQGIAGTPEQVADRIERWFRAGAADGFNLMPDAFPDTLEAFVDEVVPLLQHRGIFRRDYSGSTLAEHIAE